MDRSYFVHKSTGLLRFDPLQGTKHFDPWWALLMCDTGIIKFYAWLLKKYGIPTDPSTLWGTHISVIKGHEPVNKELWGKKFEPVEFWYSNQIRWDNKKHAWLDVYSSKMSEIRQSMGLAPKCNFHLTIGLLR